MTAIDASTTPPDVAIRAKPPSPEALSRKVLLAGTIAAGAIIAFALVNGLSDRPDRTTAAQEDAVTAAVGGPPETIRQASDQYFATDLPRAQLDDIDAAADTAAAADLQLEPPADPLWDNTPAARRPSAPADAGNGEGTGGATSAAAAGAVDPQVAARASPILFRGASAVSPTTAAANGDEDARLASRLTPPRSRYEIQSGFVIPAALVTALNSDLPGRVIAQVTAPVYDSVTGDHLLIPQGSRLIGTYDGGANYGDARLVLVWNCLILPNGWSINLRDMGGADPSGAAGVKDSVDNHLGRLAGAVALSAVISVVANEAEDDGDDDGDNSLTQSVGNAAAQQAAQTGARFVDRELSVRPTLRVRAGASVRVLVTRDIQLRPYSGPPTR